MYYNTSTKMQEKLHKLAKQQLGASVRVLRGTAELSQEELGLRINLDQSYISRLESGQLNPTLETIAELAAALDVSLEDIFKDSGKP